MTKVATNWTPTSKSTANWTPNPSASTTTTYNDSTVTYNSTTVKYSGLDNSTVSALNQKKTTNVTPTSKIATDWANG